MRRLFFCGCGLASSFVLAPACTSTGSCSLSFFQNVASDLADHVATKIPLDTQSGCSGASSVPLQTDPQDVVAGAPGTCELDRSDGPCVACLRGACCAVVNEACVGAAADPAACAALPEVASCIVDAAADWCAASCDPGDAGGGGP